MIAYEPAGHFVQTVEYAEENSPASHSTGSDVPELRQMWPAGHSMQDDCSASGFNYNLFNLFANTLMCFFCLKKFMLLPDKVLHHTFCK